MRIGIIGLGYVGTALKEGFKEHFNIETYDIKNNLCSCDSISELTKKTDVIFLCVHQIELQM